MGLFDRFKSGTTATQKGLTAKEWCDKGVALNGLSRPHQEALQCYDKALKIDPKNAIAWVVKAAAFFTSGRYQEALQCYDKALAIDPQYVDAQELKRVILEKIR